jgi:hypothetical protein
MRRDAASDCLTASSIAAERYRYIGRASSERGCKERELLQIAIGRYMAETITPVSCLLTRLRAGACARRGGNHKSGLKEGFKGRLNRAYGGADRGAVSALSYALSPHQACPFCHRAARSSISANRCGATFRALSQRRVWLFQPWQSP